MQKEKTTWVIDCLQELNPLLKKDILDLIVNIECEDNPHIYGIPNYHKANFERGIELIVFKDEKQEENVRAFLKYLFEKIGIITDFADCHPFEYGVEEFLEEHNVAFIERINLHKPDMTKKSAWELLNLKLFGSKSNKMSLQNAIKRASILPKYGYKRTIGSYYKLFQMTEEKIAKKDVNKFIRILLSYPEYHSDADLISDFHHRMELTDSFRF